MCFISSERCTELSSDSESTSSGQVLEYAEQSMYTAQIKSEPVTNQAFMAFPDALHILRPRDSPLEWAAGHDSLVLPLPNGTVVQTVDDGGLVHRFRDATGKWKLHPQSIRHCRVEVCYI
jgi:hypothetical protein